MDSVEYTTMACSITIAVLMSVGVIVGHWVAMDLDM